MKIRGIIYKYTSPSGRVYIGQTTEEKRRRTTFFNLNKSYGGKKIDDARKKHLPNNFAYEIIYKEYFIDRASATIRLDELEEMYIEQYDSYKGGYNMTFGGYTNRGYKYTEEQKKQLSISRIGKKGTPKTNKEKETHSKLMKQKWATDEYRNTKYIADNSPEYKAKLSALVSGEKNGMYGKTHTPEAKRKMSESRSGENNIWFGKKKSEEYCRKISDGRKKYYETNIVSEETRQKISDSCSINVSQFTIDNLFIATYKSSNEAGKRLNIDPSCITKCCKNKRQSAGGFKWKYSDNK